MCKSNLTVMHVTSDNVTRQSALPSQMSVLIACRDVSQLLQEQIELYRSTKQNILQGLSEEAFTLMTPQARERALLQEMKSEHNLHPALYPHDKGPFTGHYKVYPFSFYMSTNFF